MTTFLPAGWAAFWLIVAGARKEIVREAISRCLVNFISSQSILSGSEANLFMAGEARKKRWPVVSCQV
jgi:hypothetical protein